MNEKTVLPLMVKNYFTLLQSVIDRIDPAEINEFIGILLQAYRDKKQVFIMGNGGSASNASHFACDFNKSSIRKDNKDFRMICLNDNIPMMMAYANDYGYENIFCRPLENFLNENDVVIMMSGSGNSKNVIRAAEYANKRNAITVAITGYDGGRLKDVCRHSLHVPVQDMQIAEDIHLVLAHAIMRYIDTTIVDARP